MVADTSRPSRLSGWWACLVGGAVMASLLVFLDPILHQQDCPNAGGNGNASAFANSDWDFYLPLVMIGWAFLVIMEQALPVTWRGRSRLNAAVRAATAVAVSLSGSCWLFLQLATVCR
ncbi:hypothetical protein ABT297_22970 [Dactylosporangium sp. NPDC000555]|uniref:hypothetical protein n=1 Tax=Dactylosporangium sp. NPDC000555 TaxID=3154260 RepID=UPI00331E3C74